jgi:hypothetical protein
MGQCKNYLGSSFSILLMMITKPFFKGYITKKTCLHLTYACSIFMVGYKNTIFYPKIIHFGFSGRLQDMCDWFSIESIRDYKEPFT